MCFLGSWKCVRTLIVVRSTHNTRIERLWLECGRHFARGWRAFFTRLERLHFLDRGNPHHIWLLHTLFLDEIQEDCDEFCKHWNSHPLSGKGGSMSPLVRPFCVLSAVSFVAFLIYIQLMVFPRTYDYLAKQNMVFTIKQMWLTPPYCTATMGQAGQ